MIYSNPTGNNDRFAAVNTNTGEDVGDLQFGRRIRVDKTHFLKFYAEGVRMFLGLKSPGIKVFMIIYQLLIDDPDYQQDKIDLTYSLLDENIKASISRTTFTRGVKELRNVNFLAPTMHDGVYWMSHPSWVRGLKFLLCLLHTKEKQVAPFMGAWIEIRLSVNTQGYT